MNKNSKEDSNANKQANEMSLNEVTTNLGLVLPSVHKFVNAITNCYTVGDVDHKSFRYLRNTVTADSVYFLKYIIPYFKKALMACQEFFEIMAAIEFKDFIECNKDIKNLGDSAVRELNIMLALSQTAQAVFKKKSVQAQNLLMALKKDYNIKNDEIKELSNKREELRSIKLIDFIPIINLINVYFDIKEIKKCDDKISENKEYIFIIVQATDTVKSDLVDAATAFHQAIQGLTAAFSYLTTETTYIHDQYKNENKNTKSETFLKVKFGTIKSRVSAIPSKITKIIQILDVMHGDMVGLDIVRNATSSVQLGETIFIGQEETSLELAVKKEGHDNRIRDFLKI